MNISVHSKPNFYKRWINNEFGNRLRVWESFEDLLQSDYRKAIGIRYKTPNSKYMKYNVSFEEVEATIQQFVYDGADPKLFTYGEMAPDQYVLLNGEIVQTEHSYALIYSTLKTQMRTALAKRPQWATGLEALEVIRTKMNPICFDEMMELMNNYPMHVIEFSIYSINLGNFPNRNTLIWEVRYGY